MDAWTFNQKNLSPSPFRLVSLEMRVQFEHADAEHLPVADASVDAAVCECAFCTFPDKVAAVFEGLLSRFSQEGLRSVPRLFSALFNQRPLSGVFWHLLSRQLVQSQRMVERRMSV